ncbi:Cytochrome c-type heme lyase, partial [Galemys pyrenaicus]
MGPPNQRLASDESSVLFTVSNIGISTHRAESENKWKRPEKMFITEQAWKDTLKWESLHAEQYPFGPPLMWFEIKTKGFLQGQNLILHEVLWVYFVNHCGTKFRNVIHYCKSEVNKNYHFMFWTCVILDLLFAMWDRMKIT